MKKIDWKYFNVLTGIPMILMYICMIMTPVSAAVWGKKIIYIFAGLMIFSGTIMLVFYCGAEKIFKNIPDYPWWR